MTNKDYELIAKVIAKFPDERIAKADLVIEFCKALQADNPRFIPVRFVIQCLDLDFKDQDAVAAEFDNEKRK